MPNATTTTTIPEKLSSLEEYPTSLKQPSETLPVPSSDLGGGPSEPMHVTPPLTPETPTETSVPETPEELAARDEHSKEIMDKALERAYPMLEQYPMDHRDENPPGNPN